jgi:hypothetical protein
LGGSGSGGELIVGNSGALQMDSTCHRIVLLDTSSVSDADIARLHAEVVG